LSPSSLPPYELRLRQNCIFMLIRNLSNEVLYNDTRLMIIALSDHLLKTITSDKVGDIVFLNCIITIQLYILYYIAKIYILLLLKENNFR